MSRLLLGTAAAMLIYASTLVTAVRPAELDAQFAPLLGLVLEPISHRHTSRGS